MAIDFGAITEALRRRTGGQPSNAGDVSAQTPTTPQTPFPASFVDRSQPQPNTTANQTMSQPTINTLGKQKGEATMITQALIDRMKKLGEQGQ
jgi:hypothetical protein